MRWDPGSRLPGDPCAPGQPYYGPRPVPCVPGGLARPPATPASPGCPAAVPSGGHRAPPRPSAALCLTGRPPPAGLRGWQRGGTGRAVLSTGPPPAPQRSPAAAAQGPGRRPPLPAPRCPQAAPAGRRRSCGLPLPAQDGGGRRRAGAGLPPGDRQVRPGDQGGRAGTAARPRGGSPLPGLRGGRCFAGGARGCVCGARGGVPGAGRADRAAALQDIRDCPGPLGALTELNAVVKEKFRHLRGRIQELEQMAKEQDKESEKQALLREVENHKKQMLSNQAAWRKANLACKIAIDNSEKDQLLQGRDSLRHRKTTKESLAESASNITESLMGISRMMSQQVQQSEETVQTLANSSRTILEANEEFKSMSGTIQLGRKLITKYNRRELTDKLLIFLALALFLATVLYILKKRLFPFL
uniref:BCL2 interacting protein 1 n=1 Tax=Falco tinnunculus TaxID=100819 RepID=A0A8C4XRP1_FALTI